MHGIRRCAEFWYTELQSHPDRQFANKICDYVMNGIPIEYDGSSEWLEIKNWPSTIEYEEQVNEWIKKHMTEGAIEGPFDEGIEIAHTSPLGAFLKKGKNKICVIHDLS